MTQLRDGFIARVVSMFRAAKASALFTSVLLAFVVLIGTMLWEAAVGALGVTPTIMQGSQPSANPNGSAAKTPGSVTGNHHTPGAQVVTAGTIDPPTSSNNWTVTFPYTGGGVAASFVPHQEDIQFYKVTFSWEQKGELRLDFPSNPGESFTVQIDTSIDGTTWSGNLKPEIAMSDSAPSSSLAEASFTLEATKVRLVDQLTMPALVPADWAAVANGSGDWFQEKEGAASYPFSKTASPSSTALAAYSSASLPADSSGTTTSVKFDCHQRVALMHHSNGRNPPDPARQEKVLSETTSWSFSRAIKLTTLTKN